MNKTSISWLGLGVWGALVLLLGLLLSTCGSAGPAGNDPGGTREEAGPGVTAPDPGGTPGEEPQEEGSTPDDQEETLATSPADCLAVDATGTITGFYETKPGCDLTEFTIPRTKGTTTIIVIGTEAFRNKGLTKITIPDSVITIEERAFLDNKLTSLSIPNSVETIGVSAFQNNQLTSLSIGNSVKKIESFAFTGNQFESLNIPNSVETIGDAAFYNQSLVTVILNPNSRLTFLSNSFFNDLLAAYDGPDKGKPGTWTWNSATRMWGFTAKQ